MINSTPPKPCRTSLLPGPKDGLSHTLGEVLKVWELSFTLRWAVGLSRMPNAHKCPIQDPNPSPKGNILASMLEFFLSPRKPSTRMHSRPFPAAGRLPAVCLTEHDGFSVLRLFVYGCSPNILGTSCVLKYNS